MSFSSVAKTGFNFKKKSYMKKKLSFLFIYLPLLLVAQKPSIQLTVSDKSIEIGQVISFTAKSNITGDIVLDLPSGFIQGGTMNGMEQTMDQNGNMVVSVNLTQEGVFRQEGKYQIYAYIKDRSKTHRSNLVSVTVKKKGEINKKSYDQEEGDITKSNLKEPIFGIIEKSASKVYEGEALVLRSKVFSRLNINMMQGYKPFTLKGPSETYELDKSTNISLERENYKGNSYLTFSCGKQLVFISNPGKFVIKPFAMSLQFNNGGFFDQTTQIESNATMIEVLPLPKGAPNDFIGAVGKFEMESGLSKASAVVGDIVSLKVKISGTGNLHAIQKPKIRLPKGLIFYGDPEIKEELDYEEEGVTGYKSFVYFLKVVDATASNFNSISISYFHPDSKKYITIQNKLNQLAVTGGIVDTVAVANNLHLEQKLQKENVELVVPKSKSTKTKSSKFSFLFVFLSIVLFFGIVFIYFKRKRNQSSIVDNTLNTDEIVENYNVLTVNKSEDIWKDFDDFVIQGSQNEALSSLHKIILQQLQTMHGEIFTSKEELKDRLLNDGKSESAISDLIYIINLCESSRYGMLVDEVDCILFKLQVLNFFKI
jgi:hypothetical protein